MTVSQFAALFAVHGRSGVAVTATSPFAPFTDADVSSGAMEKESAAFGRPPCEIASVSVPILTTPDRAT